MNLVWFLLKNSKLTPNRLAAELHRRGLAHGASDAVIDGKWVRRVLEGKKHPKAWFIRAALEFATELGWRAASAEDVRHVVRNYRAYHPNARFSEFALERRRWLAEGADVATAWAEEIAARPAARMTAEDFADTIARLPRPLRGQHPSLAIDYARRVLVDGKTPQEVADSAEVSRQTVSRAAVRIWKFFSEGTR